MNLRDQERALIHLPHKTKTKIKKSRNITTEAQITNRENRPTHICGKVHNWRSQVAYRYEGVNVHHPRK